MKFHVTLYGLSAQEADCLVDDLLCSFPDKVCTLKQEDDEGPPAYESYQKTKTWPKNTGKVMEQQIDILNKPKSNGGTE